MAMRGTAARSKPTASSGSPWHSLLEPFGRRRHLPSTHVEQRPTAGDRSNEQVASIAKPELSVEEVADPLRRPRLDAHRLAGERPSLNPNNQPAHHPAKAYLRQPVDADTEMPRVLGRRFLQVVGERHEAEAS